VPPLLLLLLLLLFLSFLDGLGLSPLARRFLVGGALKKLANELCVTPFATGGGEGVSELLLGRFAGGEAAAGELSLLLAVEDEMTLFDFDRFLLEVRLDSASASDSDSLFLGRFAEGEAAAGELSLLLALFGFDRLFFGVLDSASDSFESDSGSLFFDLFLVFLPLAFFLVFFFSCFFFLPLSSSLSESLLDWLPG